MSKSASTIAIALVFVHILSCADQNGGQGLYPVELSPEVSADIEKYIKAQGELPDSMPIADCDPIDSGDAKEPLCYETPEGRGSAQGNTDEYIICIPPIVRPGKAADRMCEALFGKMLRRQAASKALYFCIERHNVKCEQNTCPVPCVNTVTKVSDQGMIYEADHVFCKGPPFGGLRFSSACKLSNTDWECDCACPKCPKKSEPPITLQLRNSSLRSCARLPWRRIRAEQGRVLR